MSKLSVVLATYNEEKNLAACLESIKDIADEIVIVDGSSTDKTKDIAKKFGARIKNTTNKPNFHINKQMAIDMAKGDWILQLDADEHVSKELKEELSSILRQDSKEFNGYWMPRKNWFLGRFLTKGGQYPDYTLRFYRNGKGKLPQKDVHEQAVVDGKVGYLKSALLHYPYKNFSKYVQKWQRYNKLFADQIRQDQKNKNFFQKIFYAFGYLFLKPTHWFFTTYFRHKGFVDSWQGFVFSLFSALRFPVSYIEYVGWYKFISILIIIIAAIIRLWNYPQRWGLGGDDSRDALIALEAIKRHELPLTGSFSSAGPFVFGPIFYWFIMLSYLVLPFYMGAPWIMMEAISIITVGLIIYLGKILIDNKFSIIIGILAAFSPQLVVRSLTLGQHTFVATFTILAIIFFVHFYDKKKPLFAFLMGISIGMALSMHYQAINLLILFFTAFLIPKTSVLEKINFLIVSLIGFFIPTFPLLFWDSHQRFANVRNVLDYFLIGQYRIYVPNNWKIFALKDFPQYWAFVSGKFYLEGLLFFLISPAIFIYSLITRKISGKFSIIGVIFLIMIFLSRYYRGERSEGYLLYMLPFVLIFTSYLIYKIYLLKLSYSKIISAVVVCIIIISNWTYIQTVLNYVSPRYNLEKVSKNLIDKYPQTKFSIYDYKYRFYSDSMALSLISDFNNTSDINGKKIGFSCWGYNNCPPQNLPIINKDNVLLVDISTIKNEDFNKSKKLWINVNQPTVYVDLIGWLNGYNLKSSFDLQKFIGERVGGL